jgi:hypothetical protein
MVLLDSLEAESMVTNKEHYSQRSKLYLTTERKLAFTLSEESQLDSVSGSKPWFFISQAPGIPKLEKSLIKGL